MSQQRRIGSKECVQQLCLRNRVLFSPGTLLDSTHSVGNMKRAKVEHDLFSTTFECQTEVLLGIAAYLMSPNVFRCQRVSRTWSVLWSSNAIWLRLFASEFFPIQLRGMDTDLCRALFPQSDSLVLDMFVCHASSRYSRTVHAICAGVVFPAYTRRLQMQLSFIATLRCAPMSEAEHMCAVSNDLDALLRLQEYWQSQPLFVPCAFVVRNKAMFTEYAAFTTVPKWLQEMAMTVCYDRFSLLNLGVHVSFVSRGQRCVLVYHDDAQVRGGYMLLATLENGVRKSKTVTCRGDWSERMSVDMMYFLETRRDHQVETTVDDFEAHVAHLVWKCHPVNKLVQLTEVMPNHTWSEESDRWWFARFVHVLLGRYSPFCHLDLGPPSLGAFCYLENALGKFINYHKGAHDG